MSNFRRCLSDAVLIKSGDLRLLLLDLQKGVVDVGGDQGGRGEEGDPMY